MPIVLAVEFRDRSIITITHPNKEAARILDQAERIKMGKPWDVRTQYQELP